MTAAYWMIGRHIVEFEQSGEQRADYGEEIVERLATDLSIHYGRGFSIRNVWNMKAFYLAWPIPQTASAESESSEDSPDSVWRIFASQRRLALSASLVRLCAATIGQ